MTDDIDLWWAQRKQNAYTDGVEACRAYKDISFNPFVPHYGDPEHEELADLWDEGFKDTYRRGGN